MRWTNTILAEDFIKNYRFPYNFFIKLGENLKREREKKLIFRLCNKVRER